jgi:hypothetical protein
VILRKALIFGCAALAALGFGQQKYAQQSHTIRAGVLLLDTDLVPATTQSNNWAPFVWYNLDLDASIKPAGWIFNNPNHSTTFSAAVAARWSIIGGTLPSAGAQLTKNMAPYWELSLNSATDQQLANYDILLVPAHGQVLLTPVEKEKLRTFMDEGGIVWIDLNQGSALTNSTDSTTDLVNTFPLQFKLSPTVGSYLANFESPILSYPNILDLNDLNLLPGPNPMASGGITNVLFGDVNTAALPLYQELEPVANSLQLNTIYGTPSPGTQDSIISVGQVGDGFEVVTTNDLASNMSAGQADTCIATSPTFTPAIHAASKFITNIIELSSQYGQAGKGARKSGSSNADIGAPLITQWNDIASYTPFQSSYGYNSPVVYKNLVVVTNGTGIFVYDENPSESLTGSGNPDDGFQDFSNGSSYDLVFQSGTITGATTPISSATCFEVPTPGTVPGHTVMQDQIWVEDSAGNLFEWNAFGHYSDGNYANEPPDNTAKLPTPASFNTTSGGAGPYPPTYQDGLLFASDMEGPGVPYSARVWIVDPAYPDQPLTDSRGATQPWEMGGAGSGLPESSGPVSVGYVPINDGSGGLDRVIYVPTQPSPNPTQSAGVSSLWLGVKDESPAPSSITLNSSNLDIPYRAYASGALLAYNPLSTDLTGPDAAAFAALAPHVTIYNGTEPMSPTLFNSYVSQVSVNAGDIELALTGGGVTALGALLTAGTLNVKISYTIDWGTPTPAAVTPNDLRGQLFLLDQTAPTRRILNNIALGPNAMMYMVLSSQNSSGTGSGGSYYAVQDQGKNNFVVKNRWDLYDQHSETLENVTPNPTVPPAVDNLDPLISLIPALGNATTPSLMQDLTFTSGPVVSNGVVYVTAQGDNGGTGAGLVDDTVLLAFNAQPPPLTIKVPSLVNGNTLGSFSLLQADMATSTSLLALNYSAMQPTQYTYVSSGDVDSDSINTGGLVKINSLGSGVYQSIGECFSTSQPVILRNPPQPDTLIYPDSNGSHWSPLLWYAVFTGSGLPPTATAPSTAASTNTGMGPPFVSGSTVYVPTNYGILNLLDPSDPTGVKGIDYGLSTVVSPTDPFLIPDTPGTAGSVSRPWLTQLVEFTGALSNLTPNPDFEWPQLTGVQSITDVATRFSQATLGTSTFSYGAVGGNGRLFSWSDAGLFAFEKANIYVADSNRVASFDSDGNPLWSTDQSLDTGTSGNVGAARSLVSPTRAYPFANNQTLVVDAGANRLPILNQTGVESRAIEGFTVDPGFAPDGYTAGETTNLAGPRDVQTYTETKLQANIPFTSPAPTGEEYWVHYLIADSGNRRLVDIVDRYAYNTSNGTQGPLIASGLLYWHSPALATGGIYSYTSVSRAYYPAVSGYVIAAGIGNPTVKSIAQSTSSQSQVGGIVLFPPSGPPVQINNIGLGSVTGLLFGPSAPTGSELSGAFNLSTAITSRDVGVVNSITANYMTPPGAVSPTLTLLYTDQTGVYEIEAPTGPLIGTGWTAFWMLPRSLPIGTTLSGANGNSALEAAVYSVMRTTAGEPTADNPLDFVPTYAERLTNGDIMVCNGYSGRFRKGAVTDDTVPFTGEILELDPTTYNAASQNLGFTSASIKLVLQTLTGTRSIVQPLFADRR